MARKIRLELAGAVATADLHDDVSPKSAESLWQSLPVETEILQDTWSGSASTFSPGGSARADAAEALVCSIYQGTVVLTPEGRALIGYGVSEYRDELGTLYAARVARVRDGWPAFQKALTSVHEEGRKRIRISRAE
jgi:hypothetical protein